MAYYMNQVFQDPVLSQSQTFQSLNQLINSTSNLPNSNTFQTNLIFGDFISAYNILKNLISGQFFASVFTSFNGQSGLLYGSGFGGLDASFALLVTVLFDTSLIFFLLYIISFRSI